MKNYGKVTNFNGVYGKIKGIDGVNYMLLDKNIVSPQIKINDNVEFEQELFKTIETETNVARFVRVMKKDK